MLLSTSGKTYPSYAEFLSYIETDSKPQVQIGNNILTENNITASTFTGDLIGTATQATTVKYEQASVASYRHVWFSDSTTAGKLVIHNSFKYNPDPGILCAPIFSGNLTGKADTATALTTNDGYGSWPVYFSGGKPVKIEPIDYSDTEINREEHTEHVILFNENTAKGFGIHSKLLLKTVPESQICLELLKQDATTPSCMKADLFDGTASNAVSLNSKAESALSVSHASTATQAASLGTNAGSSTRPVYFSGGVPVQTSTTLAVSITGNAATATQAVSLGTNAGSTTLPVYFSGGKPVATSTTLAISITGNASTATTANNATSLNNKAESALSVSHASTASSATSATSATSASYASRVVTSAKQTGSYHLTMVSESTSDTDGADIFVSNSKALTYNVSTGVLSATKFSGTFSGNASSATSATSAGYTAKVSATSSSDKNYIIGAASIGSSQSILANANIYVTNGDIVVNPTISTNEITHSDDNLVIGDRTNANYVNFVEDAMFDHSVSIEGALEVADEATFNATTYMNGNVYINNMLPVLNASTNSMGYGIRVLSSTEFAALQDISTSVIYFITP